jgi:hypothetical protein
MWIKQIKKKNTKGGKVFCQYQLTRTARAAGKTRHISILYLGSSLLLEDLGSRKVVAKLLESKITGRGILPGMLDEIPVSLSKLANEYYEKYLIKYPEGEAVPDIAVVKEGQTIHFEEIEIDSTQLYESKEIGSEWLCYKMLEGLGLEKFLRQKKWKRQWIEDAKISIISRAILAASEHKTAQWLNENSALLEIFNQEGRKITHHHLYKSASRLYGVKEELESYLYHKTKELFTLEDSLLIYDLTNTYFESPKRESELAKYGRSKEKRNDCKQVVLGAVINKYGFLHHSKIYSGNMSDPATLSDVIAQMEEKSGGKNKKKTLVLDAGIASEDNLKMLRDKQIKYVCVSRRRLKDYEAHVDQAVVRIQDSHKNKIELKLLKGEEKDEQWLYVRSEEKRKKEHSMKEKLHQRFVEHLEVVSHGIHKKGGTKKIEKVWERIGRIKERNSRVQHHYEIKVDHKDGKATAISWQRKKEEEEENKKSGVYFLRTTYKVDQEEQLWQIYNLIREVEATFRCLKTDLNLRPIYHQEDQYIEAHLNLGLIAYQLVNTIRYKLKEKAIDYSWSNIVRIMNTQKITSVEQRAKTKNIKIRTCTKPNAKVAQIYTATGVKHMPIKPRKFVVYH